MNEIGKTETPKGDCMEALQLGRKNNKLRWIKGCFDLHQRKDLEKTKSKKRKHIDNFLKKTALMLSQKSPEKCTHNSEPNYPH